MADSISFDKEAKSGLVSVIIPTRNGARFVSESLASIARQTYSNWEVIVVEDGSNDGTCQIVKDFSRKHRWHRIEYLRNEQSCGAAHTRNVAFRKARGQFVALLDVDDRWLPNHLLAATEALNSSGKDIAYSSAIMIEDQTDLLLGVWGPTTYELATFPHSLFGRSFVTPSATVLRRHVLADVGPWETYRYCEDFAYWLRCVQAGKSFQYVSGCHCLYRKNNPAATTHRLCGTLEEVAQVTEQYMKMPGLRRDTCQRFAAKAFWVAARFHRKSNPVHDPSADRSRTGPLLLHAWRLRPKHIDWLLEGSFRSIGNLFRRRKESAPNAGTAPTSAESKLRAAA